jgi:hypothetical protein
MYESLTIRRTNLRMLWILRRIQKTFIGFCIAWDEEVVDDFIKEFPEAANTTVRYVIGADSCPMLNRAANRAKRLGFLQSGHVGTEDARSYNQRTWARTWSLTAAGKDYIKFVDFQKL